MAGMTLLGACIFKYLHPSVVSYTWKKGADEVVIILDGLTQEARIRHDDLAAKD